MLAWLERELRADGALQLGGRLAVQSDMPSGSTEFFFDVFGYFQ